MKKNEPYRADKPPELLVWAERPEEQEKARQLAEKLSAGLVPERPDNMAEALLLRLGAQGLTLESGGLTLRNDLTRMENRIKPANLSRELLVKAARVKTAGVPVAVDATAGMGEDALLLAAMGFRVLMFELDPVIAALLRDALERAQNTPALERAAARMQLFEEDSIKALHRLAPSPDVVFLDPMFPARQKSALVKKKFQLLHRLEQPCLEEEALLAAALAARPRKVIIKRPVKGPYLAGRKPDYSLAGKAVRYDCIVLPPRGEDTEQKNAADR